jgi:hypothetical protein
MSTHPNTETETGCEKGEPAMANTKSAETQEQQVAFRGKGADNEYRVLLGEQEIGRVRRITNGEKQGLWVPHGMDRKKLRGSEPTSRNRAGQALVRS